MTYSHDELIAAINRELDRAFPRPRPSRRDRAAVFVARQVLRLANPRYAAIRTASRRNPA